MRTSIVVEDGTPIKLQERGSFSSFARWCPLDAAATRLDVPIVQRALVQMGPYKPEHARKYSAALHAVLVAGHEPLCRLLLVCRADPVLRRDKTRAQAAVEVAKQHLVRLVRAFALVGKQKGQELHVTTVVTSVAETMCTAVSTGSLQFVHLIFDAAARFSTGSKKQDVDILSRAVQQRNACGQSLMHLWVTADAEAEDRQAIWQILSKHNVPGINARDGNGDSPLHLAVRQAVLQIRKEDSLEKLKLVQQLMEARAHPDLADAHMSETPLMEATSAGDVAACSLLLDSHADMNSTSATGMSVLDFAAAASPEVKEMFQSKTRQQGIMAKVFGAVRELDSGRLHMLLRRHGPVFSNGSISILEPNGEGQTVLHFAAQLKVTPEHEELAPEIVGHLWSAAADLNCRNWLGETPLIVAARAAVKRRNQVQDRARLAVTCSFLNLGANPNTSDAVGETALMEAASEGDLPLCSLLLTGKADVTQKSNAGRVAADFLKCGETPELAQLLGSPGGHTTTEEPWLGQSQPEEADPENRTQVGVDQETEPIIPDAITPQAVRSAVENGDVQALQGFMRSARDPSSLVSQSDCDGSTLLFLAADRLPDSRTCETISLLLDFQADIEAQNVLGERPLTLAVRSALDHWQCSDSLGGSGERAVSLLLQRSATPDVADDLTGETPLMEAASRGGSDLCKLLMGWGANPRLKSKAGLNAQDFADASGHEAVLKLLGCIAALPTKNAAPPRKNQEGSLVARLVHHEFGQPRPMGEHEQFGTPTLEQRQCEHLGFPPQTVDQQVLGMQQEQDEVGYLCPNPGCVRPSGHCPPCMDAQCEEIKANTQVRSVDTFCMDASDEEVDD